MKNRLFLCFFTMVLLAFTFIIYTTHGFAGSLECKGEVNDVQWGCPQGNCNLYNSVLDRCCVPGIVDCAPGWGYLPSMQTINGNCQAPLCWTGGVTCVGGDIIKVNDDSWEVLVCS